MGYAVLTIRGLFNGSHGVFIHPWVTLRSPTAMFGRPSRAQVVMPLRGVTYFSICHSIPHSAFRITHYALRITHYELRIKHKSSEFCASRPRVLSEFFWGGFDGLLGNGMSKRLFMADAHR